MATPGTATPGSQSDGYVDDTEEPEYEVTPSDNVYSYFMFIGPTEHKKEGSAFTTDVLMAYVLLLLSFFFQGVLIYTIFNEVVIDNFEWQNSVVAGGGGALNLAREAPEAGKCNDGGSLCFKSKDGMYTCAPPSVQLTGRWSELDWNNDGIWTRAETMEHREELRCLYAVDPIEFFDVVHKILLSHKHMIWLHPDAVAGTAFHKAYFTYAIGDIAMCGYRNEDMCSNFLERGFFDAPLRTGAIPRVGSTIDTAMDYCRALLEEGGTCSRLLPSTYSVWRIDSAQQCGEHEYEKMVYTHPGSNVTKSLLSVDYEERESFERAKTTLFQLFKGTIIFLWLLAMAHEMKDILIIVTWVARFPDAAQFGEDWVKVEIEAAGDEKYTIQGITKMHRYHVGILIFLRFCMTFILGFVGLSFLSKQTDYEDLLLDGVALLFILQISEILYLQVLRRDVREQTENLASMKVRMYGIDWLNRRPAVVDSVWLVGLFIVTYAVMHYLLTQVVIPVSDALECTCLNTGYNCFEAKRFSYEWWENYWLKELPGVFEEVTRMSGGVGPKGGAVSASTDTVEVMRMEPTLESSGEDNLEAMRDVEHIEGPVNSVWKAPSRPGMEEGFMHHGTKQVHLVNSHHWPHHVHLLNQRRHR